MANMPDESMHTAQTQPERYVRRIHPAQPAVLLLIISALAYLNIYRHPNNGLRVFSLLLIAGLLVTVVTSLRMYLVADREGIAIRFVRDEVWIPWAEVARIDIAPRVRGSATVRIMRRDGTYADVPPSLLQPRKPTSVPNAMAQLRYVINALEALRP
jgi:hypothetical protein